VEDHLRQAESVPGGSSFPHELCDMLWANSLSDHVQKLNPKPLEPPEPHTQNKTSVAHSGRQDRIQKRVSYHNMRCRTNQSGINLGSLWGQDCNRSGLGISCGETLGSVVEKAATL
jgi:hypothetical protein